MTTAIQLAITLYAIEAHHQLSVYNCEIEPWDEMEESSQDSRIAAAQWMIENFGLTHHPAPSYPPPNNGTDETVH